MSSTELTGEAYEAHVQRLRAQNAELLKQLALPVGPSTLVGAAAPPKARGGKRKTGPKAPGIPTRKSERLANTPKKPLPALSYDSDASDTIPERSRRSRTTKKRRLSTASLSGTGNHNPKKSAYVKLTGEDPAKTFGHIEGVPVGSWWSQRIGAGNARVHPPPVGGIFGSASTGAYSIALSGGYPEDEDEGDRFTYTGSGGRELKLKNLRTAPQTSNQKLEGFNAALKKSTETGLPIRVIRGYKAALGPSTGYRYDGLYRATRAWEEMGSTGKYTVWRFEFVRLEGQDPVDYTAGGPVPGVQASSDESSDPEGAVHVANSA